MEKEFKPGLTAQGMKVIGKMIKQTFVVSLSMQMGTFMMVIIYLVILALKR